MSIEENKDIILRFLDEAYNKGNLEIGNKWLLSDTAMYTPSGGLVTGVEGWKQYAKVFLTALSNIDLVIEDIIAEGDKVVVRWTASGKHTGDLIGIAPTGKQLNLSGVAIYRFEDNKIVEMWACQDRLGLMQQLKEK